MEPPADLDMPSGGNRRRRTGCRCSADFCRCVVGECFATFFFILIAGTLDIDWSLNGRATPCPPTNELFSNNSIVESADAMKVIQVALTLGLGVGTLTQCFEHISGAHLNPAVTLAFLVTRQVGLLKGLFYIGVQFIGGFTAVLLLRGFLPRQIQGGLGYVTPSSLVSSHQAFGMELLVTFLFVFAVLASTDKTRSLPKSQSLQIGLAYALVTFWGFSFSGAVMNPVRILAPAVVLGPSEIDLVWLPVLEVYIAGPLLGSIAAALIYRYVFNMHRKSLDVTDSQQGSSIYDPEMDPSLVTLQRVTPYRNKMVSEM